MHLFEKRPAFRWRGLVITLVLFVAIILCFGSLLNRAGETADREQATLLQTAIGNAAVSHYATEGAYPATLSKLVAEYGIVIDEERFYVQYDVFASNIMPTIRVISLK